MCKEECNIKISCDEKPVIEEDIEEGKVVLEEDVEDMKKGEVRLFSSGASRDTDAGKLDYEGFLSPIVIQRFAQYMDKHRLQSNGSLRESDNWQKGIPKNVYMKSMFRHFMDLWLLHRGFEGREDFEDTLCAIIFNVQGYLLEVLKEKRYVEAHVF